ncbi:MAG: DUF6993 domain-containing protein [Rhodoglobus sp.]
MRIRPAHRVGSLIGLAIVSAVVLTGCVATASSPPPSGAASAAPSPTASPTGAGLQPGKSAEANRQFFDLLNTQYHEANGRGDGASIVDNLVNNGFSKENMEVTPDKTAIGLAADSIVVAITIKGECLLGQFLPENYVSSVEPLLGTGKCLVGKTRAIDW